MSKKIEMQNYPFYALIMTAMRQADSYNFELLTNAFPAVHHELRTRYHAPNGKLPSDDIPVNIIIKEI
jgi:hypothetical protein